jgi:PAS domain S-box-containing protein
MRISSKKCQLKELEPRPLTAASQTIRLLLVDDDPRYADYLRALLRPKGDTRFELAAVTCVGDGLRQLARGGYDACLLDYRLGTEDGFSLLRQAQSRSIRVPIILLTAAGDEAVELMAFAEGASEYLQKTEIDPARLKRTIVHAVARHRADAALRLRESRLAEAEAFAHVMVAQVALDGRFLKVPPRLSAMLGYAEEELLGLRSSAVTHPEDVAAEEAMRQRLVRGDARSVEFETRYLAKDKTVRWVYLNSSLVPATDAEPACLLTYIRDVTSQKQLEMELLQAQKMEAVGRLAGGVAHDFNNLLTAILGYAELLGDTVSSENDCSAVSEIQRAATSAAALTRQLLAFSRKQVLHAEVVKVDAVVTRTVSLLRRVLGDDIAVETVLPPGVPPIECDQVQLEQVILNLAVNARDAMPNGGRLTIHTGAITVEALQVRGDVTLQPGRYVTLAVQDTGCGMDVETKLRIFEPFFTTKQKDKGTGLGLATVYGIVKQSGGEIGCDTALNVGTTFTIYLPATDRAAMATAAVCGGARGGPEAVLLVEDDEAVRKLACAVLEQRGYTVVPARNPEEALQAASERTFDLLLTDLVMPNASGLDLAARLRRRQPSLAVLLMSGFMTDIEQGDIDAVGALLPKPFTPSGLASKVRETLDGTV